jgi:predicted nucleic acid-binding protein
VKVVSNTGPIIALAKIGKLNLLKSLVGEVLIPPFVHKELFGKLGAEAVRIEEGLRNFISVAAVTEMEQAMAAVLNELDEGERQAIALASAFGKDVLLLIDDRAGRQVLFTRIVRQGCKVLFRPIEAGVEGFVSKGFGGFG